LDEKYVARAALRKGAVFYYLQFEILIKMTWVDICIPFVYDMKEMVYIRIPKYGRTANVKHRENRQKISGLRKGRKEWLIYRTGNGKS